MKRGGGDAIAPKQSVLPDDDTPDLDDVPDPELSNEELFDLVSFTMTLAAPRPGPETDQTRRGSVLFDDIGCEGCHVRALLGPRGEVPAYSDLLLHDMGPELSDFITMEQASKTEFRTQPLWGVVAVAPYLHDGRAGTLDEAIRWHGGEAQRSADAYAALPQPDRDAIVAFLGSLGGAEQASQGLLAPGAPITEPGSYGGPVTELTQVDLGRFERGRAAFDRDMSYTEGVGPAFNGDSCRGCHFMPVIGGAGPSDVDAMRQGILNEAGEFLAPESGTAVLRHASFYDPSRPEPDPASNFFEPAPDPAGVWARTESNASPTPPSRRWPIPQTRTVMAWPGGFTGFRTVDSGDLVGRPTSRRCENSSATRSAMSLVSHCPRSPAPRSGSPPMETPSPTQKSMSM